MTFVPAKQQKANLIRFLGYGRLDAPYWFIGMEEGLGGANEAERLEQLRIRANSFHPLMDLQLAHTKFDVNYWKQPIRTQVWLWITRIILILESKQCYPRKRITRPEKHTVTRYVVKHLGSKTETGRSLLAELLPLPARTLCHWPYKDHWRTRADYQTAILPHRQQMFRKLIKYHKPRFVFFYGKRYYSDFKRIIPRLQITRFSQTNIYMAVGKHTTYVLMPFLGNGQIEWITIERICRVLTQHRRR